LADPNQPAGANYLAPVSIPLNLNPRGLVAADFNHDGIPDLASSYNGGGPANTRVAVMICNGNGTFQTPVLYPIGNQPSDIRVADFNHDGNPDLVVLVVTGVSVLLGNANGTFQPSVSYTLPVSTNFAGLAVADLNMDGALDLVLPFYANSVVGVSLGSTPNSATFGTVTNYNTGWFGAWNAWPGDFNGDGREDVVVTNRVSNRVGVTLSNGDGTLTAQTAPIAGVQPQDVVVADINGDGRLDAIAGNWGAGTVSVLLGNGAGGLGAATNFTVGTNPNSVRIADMNNDGRPDIVVANSGSGTVSILLNTSAQFAFTQNPLSKSVCPGGTSGTSFSAAAATNVAGGITAYRWERLVGSTWTTLPNATVAGVGDVSFSANSSSMFVINVQGNAGDLVAKVRCVATNACGTLASNPAELRIIRPCGGADVGATGGVFTGCGDGVLDNNDFVVFIDLFFSGSVIADVGSQGGVPGADGQFNNNDFVVFIDMFFSGCTI
jgi:hypothetical protein